MSQSLLAGTSLTPPVITFTEIPANIQVPGVYTEVKVDYANTGVLPFPTRGVMIGQMLTGAGGGTATPGQVYTIFSALQATALFGAGSQLADQVAIYFLAKTGLPLDAVGVAPANGAVAASGLIAFSGSPTQAGQQAFNIAGQRITIPVAVGATPAALATLLAAADTPYPSMLATLATNANAGQVAVTSVNKGALGNELDIRVNPLPSDTTPPGLTVTITPMANGAGIVDLSSVLTTIATTWYTDAGIGQTDANTILEISTFAAQQWMAMGKKDLNFWGAQKATPGQWATWVAASSWNSSLGVIFPVQNPLDPSWRWAAAAMAVGMMSALNDPSQQLKGLVLPGIQAPAPGDQWGETTEQAIVTTGGALYMVQPGGVVAILRAVTGYQLSPLGVADQSFMDIMVAKTVTRVRYDWGAYVQLQYPSAKLANDNSLASSNPNVVTPRRMWNSWAARCQLYGTLGWLDNVAANVAAAFFAIDAGNKNRLDGRQPITVMGNLMVLAGQIVVEA